MHVRRDGFALAGPIAAASFVTGVAADNGLSDAPYPRPGASPDAIRRYFSDNAGLARMSVARAPARRDRRRPAVAGAR
jgi:hypothetical protein